MPETKPLFERDIETSVDIPVTPPGTYRGTLIDVYRQMVDGQFGPQEKFFWIFSLTEVKRKVGAITKYVDCTEENLSVLKMTNTKYGASNGSMTSFLKSMIPGKADEFMETVGATVCLLGWEGTLTITNVADTKDKTRQRANIESLAVADSWIDVWDYTPNREILAEKKNRDAERKRKQVTTRTPPPARYNAGTGDDDINDPFKED
jgi:hypothetical protein